MIRSRDSSPPRRGTAIMWALAVIATVTTISAAGVVQFAAARRQTDIHRNRIEADWLARAGCELAAGRLLANPGGYAGETVTPIPASKVKITVRQDEKQMNVYRIESEARFPDNERDVVVHTERRTLKRVEGPQGVRLESVAGEQN